MRTSADIVVVGAGAAGLMAAIWAARTAREERSGARVIAVDGASRLGAKILVAGGGRCNVTHFEVSERDYAVGPGSTLNAVRNVLRAFPVSRTVEFFAQAGVELKREETGKLFPTTDDAHTVLSSLLRAAAAAGAQVRNPWRVEAIEHDESDRSGFLVRGPAGEIAARRIIIATGGKSLPKTGSDGHGYDMVRGLGHTITPTFPALVPLLVDKEKSFVPSLSGIAHSAEVTVVSSTGRKLAAFTDSLLCTHFGLSGPAALNISRYLSAARREDRGAGLVANWLPGQSFEAVDTALVAATASRRSTLRALLEEKSFGAAMPERLARAILESAGIDPAAPAQALSRDARRVLARTLTGMPIPVTGDRGYLFAEVTAGGVPLSEVRLDSMESRVSPGLHLCGEILDVDGRIGGFNFQWAWATGFLAGCAAARGAGRGDGSAMPGSSP
jgi:predicted Rossmann fold flavoprotein